MSLSSLVAQLVKNLPAIQETQVRSPGQEDPLEKKMAIHSSIPCLKISMNRRAGSLDSKTSAYKAGDPGSIPVSGRSPGEENGNPLQYSCLENPMDGGAW